MKRKILLACGIFCLNISLPLFAKPPLLDPYLKILERLHRKKESSNFLSVGKAGMSSPAGETAEESVGVFIKTRDMESLRNFMAHFSGKIHSIIGDIVTAQLPLTSITALRNVKGVDYVEWAQPVKNNLNVSLGLVRGDIVHSGSASVPTPYLGTGVVVGIVDTGIDWNHVTFKEGRGFGNTRVQAIWDQSLDSSDGFVGPREIAQTYGLECLRQDLILGNSSLCPSKDTNGHGTHVAGIAAGNYFEGLAPKADIIAVKMAGLENSGDWTPTLGGEQAFSNHLVDGVNYIFQKAAALGKPAVVNLSLGTHFGPHDSTSLFEQALNNLVNERPGRSIVVAAGNDNRISGSYFASLHAGFPLNGETRAVEMVSPYPLLHGLILDVWQSADSNLSFGIGIDNYETYETTPSVMPGEAKEYVTQDGALRIVMDASETANPLNGKRHCVIAIAATNQNDGVAVAASKYVFDFIVSGRGDFNAWIARGGVFTKRSGTLAHTGFTYQAGDSQHTVSIPATASGVLSVASYAGRNNFNGLSLAGSLPDLGSVVLGKVSSFSSIGPTVNPSVTGQKPEIAAPGEWILSAMSYYARGRFSAESTPRTGDYVMMSGTSMAAPHVTGAVALLLERNPALTAQETKQKLCQATVWGVAGREAANPDNRWGYGRLDILHAMTAFDAVDYVAGGLTVSDAAVPEIAYDGGATDGAADGRLASVSKRDSEFFKNVNVEGTRLSAEGVENPLEPAGGGCSLSRGSKSSPFWLFFGTSLLILFCARRAKKNHFLAVFFLIFLVGCGGAAGGGDGDGSGQNGETPPVVSSSAPDSSSVSSPAASQQAPVNLLSSLSLSDQQAQVFLNEGWVVAVTVNSERTKEFVLFLPLTSFFTGETIPLGANGLYGLTQREGFLAIYEGSRLGFSDAVIRTEHISTSGSATLSDADIKSGFLIRGSFQVDQIMPLNLNTNLLQREAREITSLHSDFSAEVLYGGSRDPYIVSYSPTSGAIGTHVHVKGFNLGEIVTAKFSGSCPGDLPFAIVSGQELVITVDRFACESPNRFQVEDGWGNSADTQKGFEIQIPYLKNFPVPGMSNATGRLAYDPSRELIYFPDTSGNTRLRVFSLSNASFLQSVYFNQNVYRIDTTQDGGFLFVFHSYWGPETLFSLSNIGEVATLAGELWTSTPYVDQFFWGKGRKGLMGTSYGTRLVDLDSGTITDPSELRADFGSSDTLLRSANRKFIVLNSGASSFNPDVVYHALDDGSFEKLASAFISQKILGVAETSGELWAARRVYNTALVQQAEITADIPQWDLDSIPGSLAIGVVFDPSERYAMLISKRGVVHIFDRASKTPLVLNIPIINLRNHDLNDDFFISSDGSKLVLTSAGFLHLVDLTALLRANGL